MGADLRVWCSQCGVPASVLVSDCTYGQSPNPRRVAAAPSRNSVTVEHRAAHDGFDEFFERACCELLRLLHPTRQSQLFPREISPMNYRNAKGREVEQDR